MYLINEMTPTILFPALFAASPVHEQNTTSHMLLLGPDRSVRQSDLALSLSRPHEVRGFLVSYPQNTVLDRQNHLRSFISNKPVRTLFLYPHRLVLIPLLGLLLFLGFRSLPGAAGNASWTRP